MGRVIKTIEVEGKPAKAFFDPGAFHSCVARRYLQGVPLRAVPEPYQVSLGGDTFVVSERALVNGKIEGLNFDTTVVPIDSLGKVDGHDLDAIIGAITMEQWEITVDPKNQSLGLDDLKGPEFIEY